MKPYLPQHRQVPIPTQSGQEEGTSLLFAKFFSSKAISFYLIGLLVCNVLFFNKILSPLFWVSGIVAIYGFFQYSKELSKKWSTFSFQKYEKKLFGTALIIRIIWVLVSYLMYQIINGQPFEWSSADALGYHKGGEWVSGLVLTGKLQLFFDSLKDRYSDMGYSFYLGVLYAVTGKSILIARILKAVYGAYTCVLIYRFAKRTFGEQVGRLAGIFCLLMPNLIMYCGIHTKEVEMVFLTVLFMEQSDKLLRDKVFSFKTLLLPVAALIALFFFRTMLGVAAVLAVVTTVLFSVEKKFSWGRRIFVGLWMMAIVGYFVFGTILNEIESTWQASNNSQQTSMEFRATRENGNKFAKYAGAAVFAPMIFVIPFPTVVGTPDQQNQQLINGGNFVKNVLAFFVIIGVSEIVRNKKIRQYLLIESFTLIYLAVLAKSAFAQSERFHQPVLPFELILAAYGLSVLTSKQKKWYQTWLMLLVVIMVAWSWFKLAGRGMA